MPPTRFYLYDAPDIPTSVERELAAMLRCQASSKLYPYGGEYWFLRSLVSHPWRTRVEDNVDDLQRSHVNVSGKAMVVVQSSEK